jgi:hypothetical protein
MLCLLVYARVCERPSPPGADSAGLQRPADNTEQDAGLDQPRQQRLDARHHPVARRLLHLHRQPVEVGAQHPRQLAVGRLPTEHAGEGEPPHLWVGYAGLGELPDVGGDAVQTLEGVSPRSRAGPAG